VSRSGEPPRRIDPRLDLALANVVGGGDLKII
jgi:hypothetical protein